MPRSFGWLDVDTIADALAIAHPAADPFSLRFTELRAMVESLPGFTEAPGHPVNEKILEAIQAAFADALSDAPSTHPDDEDDELDD